MILEVDFNSEEALYIQLRNQIIVGIATNRLKEGESLPSVRQLAESIGINMHTVNKAYTVLKQEGFVKVDRRRGAVIAIDADRISDLEQMRESLRVILARASCRNISREEVHALIDGFMKSMEDYNRCSHSLRIRQKLPCFWQGGRQKACIRIMLEQSISYWA